MTAQHGVISRRQALGAGLTRRQIEHRVATGQWVAELPGVYRLAVLPVSLTQRAMGAALWSAPDGLVSHLTAGVLWGLEGVASDELHVTLPGARRLKSSAVVVHRTRDVLPADVARHGPLPMTSPLRTVIDLAAVLGPAELEIAIESALRRGLFSVGQLRWRAGMLIGTGRPGSAQLRVLLRSHRIGRSGSRPEVQLAQLLERAGLGRPVRQYEVRAGGRLVARVDLAYPELRIAIEYDSDEWHSGVRQRRDDAARRNGLRALGWTVVEVTVDQLRDPEPLLRLLRGLLAA